MFKETTNSILTQNGENIQSKAQRTMKLANMKRKLREMEARVRSSDIFLIGVSENDWREWWRGNIQREWGFMRRSRLGETGCRNKEHR